MGAEQSNETGLPKDDDKGCFPKKKMNYKITIEFNYKIPNKSIYQNDFT